MVDEFPAEDTTDEEANDAEESGGTTRLTQAQRREHLKSLGDRIGEHAQPDGDRLVIEAGEPVVLHLEFDRDSTYTATWWATALTENAHHRWREAAEPLLREGESIHTSALGGGYLIEIVRTTSEEAEALEWASASEPVERVRQLLEAFPEAVGALEPEPVPDYLLPPEPELPPLGEVETGQEDDLEESEREDSSM